MCSFTPNSARFRLAARLLLLLARKKNSTNIYSNFANLLLASECNQLFSAIGMIMNIWS